MRTSIWAGAALLTAMAIEPAAAQSSRELQERYCTGDAFRLCSAEIPNEDRIEACMARLRHRLSPECRAVFDQPEPTAQIVPSQRAKPRKPVQLVPQ